MLKLCDYEAIDLLIDKIQHIESLTISTHTDGKVYAEFEVTDVQLSKKECTITLLSNLQDIKKGMYISTIVNFSFNYDYEKNIAIGNITYKKVNQTEELKQSLNKIYKLLQEKEINIELWQKENSIPDVSSKKKNAMKKLTTLGIINVLKEGLDKCQ